MLEAHCSLKLIEYIQYDTVVEKNLLAGFMITENFLQLRR